MLKEPETSKAVEDGSSASKGWPCFGVASMQGWRLRMEDAHLALPDFDASRQIGLFGVFDGHGGGAVAQIVAERFSEVLRSNANYKTGHYRDALYESFFEMDRVLDSKAVRKEVVNRAAQYPVSEDEDEDDDLLLEEEGGESELEGCPFEEAEDNDDEEDPDEEEIRNLLDMASDPNASNDLWISGEGPDCMGTTAVVALVCGKTEEVYVANAGDSRCILIPAKKAKDLSRDHKPILKSERQRIHKAGGIVLNPEDGGRVDGNLSLSRALGDFAYKKNKKLEPSEQKISCEPEIEHHKLGPLDRFLVLGCDGIWEKASSQKVANFLSPRCDFSSELRRQASPTMSSACASFLDWNLAKHPLADQGLGCDNMTLMIVDLRGRPGFPGQDKSLASAPPKQNHSDLSGSGHHVVPAKSQLEHSKRLSRSARRRLVLKVHVILKHVKRRRQQR